MGIGLSGSAEKVMLDKYGMIPESGCFTGSDIVAGIYVPVLGTFRVFGELSTVTYSIHRELFPVRACGTINPKGYTRGGRTIAGTLIFTVFDRHVLYSLRDEVARTYMQMLQTNGYGYNSKLSNIKILSDELPPFDLVITMANEYNSAGSTLTIKGVRITNEGQTMSIEDMITENQMMYLAQDIDLMVPKDVTTDIAYADYAKPYVWKPEITYWLSSDFVQPSCDEYKGTVRVNIKTDNSLGTIDPSKFLVTSMQSWIVPGATTEGVYGDGKKYWDVSFTVQANSGDARTGTMRIAKLDFTVNQSVYYAGVEPINPVNDTTKTEQNPIENPDTSQKSPLANNNEILIGPTNNFYFSDSTTATVNITCALNDVNWSAIISDPTWISMSPSEGNTTRSCSILVQSIPEGIAYRTGTILINGKTIYVQQGQPGSTKTTNPPENPPPTPTVDSKVTVLSSHMSFGKTKIGTINVRCTDQSVNWEVACSASWVHIDPQRGTGNCDINVTVEDFKSTSSNTPRTAAVLINGNPVVISQLPWNS